jgi:uncharacterized protein (DUF885 family)
VVVSATMRSRGRSSLLLSAIVLASCGGGQAKPSAPGTPAPTHGEDAAFAALVDEYFAAANRFSPSDAVRQGFHEYDAQIEDRSRARYQARIAELHGFVDRLDKIDRRPLSFDNAIDVIAIEDQARAELLDLETLRLWEQSPMPYAFLPGAAADAMIVRDFAPKKERLRSLIARLRGVPAIYAAGKANVVNPPKEFTDVAVLVTRGSAGFLEGAVASWGADAAGGDAALLAELKTAIGEAVAANRDFLAWLERDLAPRSKGSYALGEARFLEKLRLEEMVELPLAELLAKGEAQLAKDRAAFLETAKRIDPRKTPHQVMELVARDHPAADDLVPAVARSVEAARQFAIDKKLITIPSEVRPKIRETPPYRRGTGFASMDSPGPFETRATEAYYYVEPIEKEWDAKHKEEHLQVFNNSAIALINVHEAFPGHYVQFLYSPRFPTKVRKLLGSGTNVEGWAHYVEQMMIDEGFGGGDPKIRLAQLSEALLRDCRYVVGVRLHTKGMTVEEGTKMFVERCFQPPAAAYVEARRGTFNPTYLYYTLGKLQIQELRDEYLRRKGATLQQFHDAFVAQGALPIPLLRKVLLRE